MGKYEVGAWRKFQGRRSSKTLAFSPENVVVKGIKRIC